jgi:hypothetical protein
MPAAIVTSVNVPSRLLWKRWLGESSHMRRTVIQAARHGEATEVGLDAVLQVMTDEQVGPSVTVEIEEDRGDTPARIVGMALT